MIINYSQIDYAYNKHQLHLNRQRTVLFKYLIDIQNGNKMQ